MTVQIFHTEFIKLQNLISLDAEIRECLLVKKAKYMLEKL